MDKFDLLIIFINGRRQIVKDVADAGVYGNSVNSHILYYAKAHSSCRVYVPAYSVVAFGRMEDLKDWEEN